MAKRVSSITRYVNIPLTLVTVGFICSLLIAGVYGTRIEFDIINALPSGNTVFSDARYMMTHHPLQDQLAIDLFVKRPDSRITMDIGNRISTKLRESGLFDTVGLNQMTREMPRLVSFISKNLPFLFSLEELNRDVAPLLRRGAIHDHLRSAIDQLSNLGGIGQAELIANDPLELRLLILKKLAHLAPPSNSHFESGYLVSNDYRHLLIVANPSRSGTNVKAAETLSRFIVGLSDQFQAEYRQKGVEIILTPVGTYRATLDNERIAKRDTQRAVFFSVIGIALLLSITFPRPWIGLLALLPAIVGTIVALFVFSLVHGTISILTLGFGGAIISITVDHAIAYFLFLDQPLPTTGRDASRETRAVCLLALLTTVGAFLALLFCGFPILAEIGEFTALGIVSSFLFLHTMFPRLIPSLPPASKKSPPLLRRFIRRLSGLCGKRVFVLTLLCAVMALFFIDPIVDTRLSSLNTVSKETALAEERFGQSWGSLFSNTYLGIETDSLLAAREKGDELLELLERDLAAKSISSFFVSSMVFPGEKRAEKNYADWRRFWTPRTINTFTRSLTGAATKMGFNRFAFDTFLNTIKNTHQVFSEFPRELAGLVGLSNRDKQSKWAQFLTVTPGENYSPGDFYKRYSSIGSVVVFDSAYFAKQLGDYLFDSFSKMVLIIGVSVVVLIYLFFLDIKLTLVALLPIVFAFIATLATLSVARFPIGITGLMLSAVILGMGVDYSLFFTRAYQRYGDDFDSSMEIVQSTVFLASASTLIGFGALSLSEHSLLRGAGLICLVGIGYSLVGAFTMIPPIARYLFSPVAQNRGKDLIKGESRTQRVIYRYKNLGAYPRLFARFKMKLDPMFGEIDRFVRLPEDILDIGCGYAVPAGWILDRLTDCHYVGLEPDPERVRIASKAIGERGSVVLGGVPGLPEFSSRFDLVMMLDMIHYLSDHQLYLTFQSVGYQLKTEGDVLIRVTVPRGERATWWRWIEETRTRVKRVDCFFRSVAEIRAIASKAGFKIVTVEPSGVNREETWMVMKPTRLSSVSSR